MVGPSLALHLGQFPVLFVPNVGQTDSRVLYCAKGPNYNLFFTSTEAVFVFTQGTLPEEQTVPLSLQFVGGSSDVTIEPQCEAPGKVNYLIGDDPAKWGRNLPTYEELIYRNLWPGVDLVWRSESRRLKYDFILHPGAELDEIRLVWHGADGLAVDEMGSLLIQTSIGLLTDEKPWSYQEVGGKRVPVEVSFVLGEQAGGECGFGFAITGGYDPRFPLVIDPGITYSTFIGGVLADAAHAVAVDVADMVYVAGFTDSPNIPARVTMNPQPLPPKETDAFVAKFNPRQSGPSSLVYLTLIGGNGIDQGLGVAVDGLGNAAVTGLTNSTNLPVTPNAFQTTFQGGMNDAFVAQLDATGSMLRYLSYAGGSGDDRGAAVALDKNTGMIILAGQTDSLDFPTTAGGQDPIMPAQGTYGGGAHDGFIMKVDPESPFFPLNYSTYAGGSGDDRIMAVAVDLTGAVWATGGTNSPAAPVSLNPQPLPPKDFQGGPSDAFVVKVTPNGNAFENFFFLGGNGLDEGLGITLDNTGNAYVTGRTNSTNFPLPSPGDPLFLNPQPLPPKEFAGGASDAFLVKVDPTASGLLFSTYFGGSGEDVANAIAVDQAGNAHLTGFTTSRDFPVTPGAFQTAFRGAPRDGFVTKISTATMGPLGVLYSSYLGDGDTVGTGIVVESGGRVDVTGFTNAADFPTTRTAFQRSYQGGPSDAFLVQIDPTPLSGGRRRRVAQTQPLFVSEGSCSCQRITRPFI